MKLRIRAVLVATFGISSGAAAFECLGKIFAAQAAS